jgi:Leucine-rich repeat (LRR) protein
MKSLEELDVMCQNLTDAGFARLCVCPSLKSLSINRCKVADAGLAHLAKLKSLEYFAIDHAPVTGDGLAVLKQCPSLRELALYFLDLNDRAISHITAMRSLEKLRLYNIGVQITDETLNQLGSLTSLKTLSIIAEDASQMRITNEGIAHLSRLVNLEYIRLNHCENVTDKGLAHLEALASLRELTLDNCRVTTAGADRLKAKIPGVSVTVPATMRAAGIGPAASPLNPAGQNNSTRNAPRRSR